MFNFSLAFHFPMAIMSVMNEIEIRDFLSLLYSSKLLATFGVSEPFDGCINHVEAISDTAGLAVFSSLFVPFTVVWKTKRNCTLFRHLRVGEQTCLFLFCEHK